MLKQKSVCLKNHHKLEFVKSHMEIRLDIWIEKSCF